MTLPRAAVSAFIIKLALACAALAGLGQIVAWDALANAAAAVDVRWAALAVAMLPLNVGLEAYRYHRLLIASRHRDRPTFGSTVVAVVGSYPLGLLTPGRLGDYAGRALYLRAIPASITAALTFVERTATLACCVAFGVIALPFWLSAREVTDGWMWLLPAGAIAAMGLICMVLRPRSTERLIGAVLPFRWLRPSVRALGALPPTESRRLLALSALRYAVFSAQFVLLLRAFSTPDAWTVGGWLGAAAGVILVFFAKSAVPGVTLGDLGVREGAAVYFLASFGEAAAFNASLGLFGINLLIPALAGLALVTRLRVDTQAPAPIQTAEAPAAAAAASGSAP